jgi:hypothetical protein
MFRTAGLHDIHVTPIVHVYPPNNSRRNILVDLLESVRDRLVKDGLMREVEFKEHLRELKRHLEDPNTLVISHLFFQVWGKKPE